MNDIFTMVEENSKNLTFKFFQNGLKSYLTDIFTMIEENIENSITKNIILSGEFSHEK